MRSDNPIRRLSQPSRVEDALQVALQLRDFRQSVGMPPHQWLMQHRVDPARELLLSSPLALSDIALACDFAGQSHFTRAPAASERAPAPGAANTGIEDT